MTIHLAPTSKATPWLGTACALALFIAGCGGSSSGASTTPEGAGSSTPDSASTSAPDSGSSGGSSSDKAEVGKKAPDVAAAYVTGEGPKSLADAKGKVVILDFWGTYCGPCKASFPKYQELLDQFGKDLAIIAVSEDDPDDAKESNLKDFAKKTGVKFTILWDKEKKTAKVYNPPNMPTSFIIDKDGNISSMHAKYEAGDEKKIAEEVKALLKK
jgi:peroxiredoxin